jgi:hypothetical protein
MQLHPTNAKLSLKTYLNSALTYYTNNVLRQENKMSEMSMSWGELALLTHATQVEKFNWCMCEEQEYFPYDDCPRKEQQ